MTKTTTLAVLRLLRVQAALEARFTAALGSVHGLALNELLLLMNLDRAPLGRMRRVDLAAALTMSQSSVTRMAMPLEKVGLVARAADPRDGRVGYVALTDAGRARVREAEATLDRLTEAAFADRWSAEEVEALSALLGRLAAPLPGHLG
ncbi:MAG TPA: MarR family transcriptional regulator [Alphaproteobacteria bacterium]|nr:MarR family transcriptional regulator [Alphaproteobacteria bacterium]